MTTPETPTETVSCPELQELAAFADGRLDREARRRMVAHLDRCRDCYETYSMTVRFLREEEGGGGELLTSPRFGRLTARRIGWIAAAAAALFVLAVVVPLLRMDPARPVLTGPEPTAPLLSSETLVAAATADGGSDLAASVWADWPEPLAFTGGLDRERVAFRIGARLLDLRAAARSGDPGAAAGALDHLEELAGLALGESLPSGPADALAEARRAVRRENSALLAAATTELEAGLEPLLDPFELAFGKWAEAGRLAAAARAEEYFLSPAFADFRASLGARRPLRDPLERQLGVVDSLTSEASGPPADLAELEVAFEGLVTLR